MRRAAARIGALLLASLLSTGAGAQRVELAPSDALQCLTPSPPLRYDVEYPFAAWKSGKKGRVKVELEFTTTDRRPSVRVIEAEGGQEFRDAVAEAVQRWRVPCLPAGYAAKLVQDFVFRPDDRRVFWSPTVDAADAVRAVAKSCLTHESGRKQPDYPVFARRRWLQGRIYTELSFTSATEAPSAAAYARPDAAPLKSEIEDWVKGYRLPCLPAGENLKVSLIYVYQMEDQTFGFKPLTLRQLLGSVKGIRQQALDIDTNTMSCPFDVHFTYLQPVRRNATGTLGGEDPTRQPLLEWLAGIELDLPDRTLDAVFADSTTITVPCLKINLNPKEPS